MRPATSTPNRGASGAGVKPNLKQFLQELDDLGVLLEDDFAEELEAALLELDRGVTLEDDFGAELLLDLAELLLEFALLELGGTTLTAARVRAARTGRHDARRRLRFAGRT